MGSQILVLTPYSQFEVDRSNQTHVVVGRQNRWKKRVHGQFQGPHIPIESSTTKKAKKNVGN